MSSITINCECGRKILVTASVQELASLETRLNGRPRKLEDAKKWLYNILKRMDCPSKIVFKEGKIRGFSKTTLKRAKRELGVKSIFVGFFSNPAENYWYWFLPSI